MPKSYCELRIKGQPDLIKGFVLGFLEGRGSREEAVLDEECFVEKDSPIDLIKHFFGHHHDSAAIIVQSELCNEISSALERHKNEVHGKVISVHELKGAQFRFHYKTFSQETGKSLIALFSNLTQGVQIEDFSTKEKLDPDGKGVEAYAPLHDYQLTGAGLVTGDVGEVYNLYCRAARFEVIELGELKLAYN